MSFIGDLFGGHDNFKANAPAIADALKAGETKPITLDNPPQKPAKPPVDQVGGGSGGKPLGGGSDTLLGGGNYTG